MKISVTFINHKGFIHYQIGKNKKMILKFIRTLKEGTEINWLSKDRLFISQQYTK